MPKARTERELHARAVAALDHAYRNLEYTLEITQTYPEYLQKEAVNALARRHAEVARLTYAERYHYFRVRGCTPEVATEGAHAAVARAMISVTTS
jgi:hypothetical protein